MLRFALFCFENFVVVTVFFQWTLSLQVVEKKNLLTVKVHVAVCSVRRLKKCLPHLCVQRGTSHQDKENMQFVRP